tara:strand:+ start:425 stop:871 length:447 start_codon:yes stop_codon:yes gene_type:complete
MKKKKAIETKKVVKPKKNALPKEYNLNTWTKAKYFGTIRSCLRRAFRYYKPMQEALNLASRPYVGSNKLQKKEFLCAECGNKWYKRADVEIDHIQELGELREYSDIIPFIQRLTTENVSDYQILCKPHHLVKTHAARDKRKELRKSLK